MSVKISSLSVIIRIEFALEHRKHFIPSRFIQILHKRYSLFQSGNTINNLTSKNLRYVDIAQP